DRSTTCRRPRLGEGHVQRTKGQDETFHGGKLLLGRRNSPASFVVVSTAKRFSVLPPYPVSALLRGTEKQDMSVGNRSPILHVHDLHPDRRHRGRGSWNRHKKQEKAKEESQNHGIGLPNAGPSHRSRLVNSVTGLRLSRESMRTGRPRGMTAQTATCGGMPSNALMSGSRAVAGGVRVPPKPWSRGARLDRLGEVRWNRRSFDGGGVDGRGVDGIPRILAVRRLRGVAPPREGAEMGERALRGRVTDDDHAPALTVSAARREARLIQDPHQYLVGQGLGGERPGGEGRAERFVHLH